MTKQTSEAEADRAPIFLPRPTFERLQRAKKDSGRTWEEFFHERIPESKPEPATA